MSPLFFFPTLFFFLFCSVLCSPFFFFFCLLSLTTPYLPSLCLLSFHSFIRHFSSCYVLSIYFHFPYPFYYSLSLHLSLTLPHYKLCTISFSPSIILSLSITPFPFYPDPRIRKPPHAYPFPPPLRAHLLAILTLDPFILPFLSMSKEHEQGT